MQMRWLWRLRKWLILGFGCLLIPLFQNMAPLQEGEVDIRDLAPAKPTGYLSDPWANYVPMDMTGHSLQSVEQQVLSHNFDPMLKDLEDRYLHLSGGHFLRNGEVASLSTDGALEPHPGQWRLGLLGPQHVRLSYQNILGDQSYRLSCETLGGSDGMKFSVSRPLGENWNLGMAHQTGARQSQIQMDYQW